MAKSIQIKCDELGIIIKQLQRIKQDLESTKSYSAPMVVTTSIPEGVTLNDLYRTLRNYSQSSAFRLKEALENGKITTLEELVNYRPRDLKHFKNIGITTIYHTREAMEDLGILW